MRRPKSALISAKNTEVRKIEPFAVRFATRKDVVQSFPPVGSKLEKIRTQLRQGVIGK